jgi:cbb3-type cytochrome oxidase subunit 3
MAAQEVPIQGANSTAKIRTPWVVAVLTLVTLGIYGFVWYYKINREMADYGRANGHTEELGDSPGTSLLAVTLGALILVPAIISVVHTHQRITALQRLTGGGDPLNGWLVLIMFLVGLSVVAYAYWQSGLNKAWEAQAGTVPAATPSPAPAG